MASAGRRSQIGRKALPQTGTRRHHPRSLPIAAGHQAGLRVSATGENWFTERRHRPQAVASQHGGSRFPHLAVRYSSNARTAWISDRSEDRKLTALRDITQHCHALFSDSPLYARQRARSSRELERLLNVLEAPQSPGTAVAATAVPVGGPGTGTGSPGAGRLGVKVVPRPSVGPPVSSFHSMHLLLTCNPGQSRFTRSRTEFDVPSRFLKVCRYP